VTPRRRGDARDEPAAARGESGDSGQLSFESRLAVPPAPPDPTPGRLAVPPATPQPTPDRLAVPPATPQPTPDRLAVPPATPQSPTLEAAPEPPPQLRDAPTPRQDERILAVHELVRAARTTLESRFSDVRVEGELSGCKRSANGHLYFVLKDAAAQLDCVMYAREAGRLRWKPQDGQLVRCRGRLTIYEGRGRFQLSVQAIEMAGAGALALAFEALKHKLAAEGLFDPERKRRLPFLPRRLGVVTSLQGAVLRDIVRVAHRRFPVPILLAAAPVQGEGAAQAIAAALRDVCQVPDVDLVIVARGGGSIEDLWAFNDEGLARAIAACPVPVISAVGHETDFTIADFVADLRAPTPSAAAELAVPVAADLLAELHVLGRRLGRALHGEVHACRLRLERARAALGDPRRLLDERRQSLDDFAERAARVLRAGISRRRHEVRQTEARLYRAHPQRRIAAQRAALGSLERRLLALGSGLCQRRRRTLETLAGKLDALSPLKVLERGYAVARGPDGQVLRSHAGLHAGDPVTVTLRDGDLRTRIEEILARAARSRGG
jgi:exodeoxyribonuclease VII large subunit